MNDVGIDLDICAIWPIAHSPYFCKCTYMEKKCSCDKTKTLTISNFLVINRISFGHSVQRVLSYSARLFEKIMSRECAIDISFYYTFRSAILK